MRIVEIESKPFHQLSYRSSGPGGVARLIELPFYRVKVDKLPSGIRSIVAASDLQGREIDVNLNRLLGEAVSDELVFLQELGEIPNIDLALLAGDLYDYPDCRKLGGTGDVTAVWNAFARNFPFVVGVHGNHDIVEISRLEDNVTILDGETIQVSGLCIGGVGGIIGPSGRNQRKTKPEFKTALKKSLTNKTKILLLHQGPNGPDSDQKGSTDIYEFLKRDGASIVLFGHCHWNFPYAHIGNNQVLNLDKRVFIFHE